MSTKPLTPLMAIKHYFGANLAEMKGLKKADREELGTLCMEHYKGSGTAPAGYHL